MADYEKRIVLGSGKLYVDTYSSTTGIPEDSALEVDSKLLGLTSGGATLEYTPTFYEAKDDLGLVSKKFVTEEEVILKSGILTWNGETLAKLTATGRDATAESETTTRTIKLGGTENYAGTMYVLHFVHTYEGSGDTAKKIRITIVGSNEAGFEMQFQKDSETVINAEFKAQPYLDDNGTLVIYKEDI